MGMVPTAEGLRKDGSTFPVDIGLSTIESGGKRLAIAFVADITQRRQLERAAQEHAGQVAALAARLLTAQEEERRRVSRELHDQICQQLASIAIEISGLAADPPPPAKAPHAMKQLQTRVIRASEATRHIAYQLHPSVLDDLGLVASLRALCRKFSEHGRSLCEISQRRTPADNPARSGFVPVPGGAGEPPEYCAAFGSEEGVRLNQSEEQCDAVDYDRRRVGFRSGRGQGRGGLGLIGMEERTRLAKGRLSIAARKGHGTRIVVEVPLQEDFA